MKPLIPTAFCVLLLAHAALANSGKKEKGQKEKQSHMAASVARKVEQAESFAPSILSIASQISVIELQSPSFRTVEKELERYYHSYSAVVDALERGYEHASASADSEQYLEELTQAHSKLAKAVSELAYVELQHSTLAREQASLQSALFTDSSLLTALTQYTELYHASVAQATQALLQADVTQPRLFGEVLHVDLAADNNPQLACALSSLSAYEYSLSSSVQRQIADVVSSVYAKSALSLAYCYPAVYADAVEVASYLRYHGSVLSAVSAYLDAAQKVCSIGSAVQQVADEQDSTAVEALHVMQSVYDSCRSLATTLSFEQMLVDSSPTLDAAAKVIQASFYASPTVASQVLLGVESPSYADSTLSYIEASHESLVSAVQYEQRWISNHPQYSAVLSSAASGVISELTLHSNLVTVLSSVSQLVSATTNAASISIAKARSLVPCLTSVVDSFDAVEKSYPELQCAERVIAGYDVSLPQTVEEIWHGLTDTAMISDVGSFAKLTAHYPALMRAFDTMLSADRRYSTLQSVQSLLLEAQKTDAALLQQWQTYIHALDSITAQVTQYSISS